MCIRDSHFTDHAWLCQRAILAPRNEAVNVINKQLLQELPGVLQIYKYIAVVPVSYTHLDVYKRQA